MQGTTESLHGKKEAADTPDDLQAIKDESNSLITITAVLSHSIIDYDSIIIDRE